MKTIAIFTTFWALASAHATWQQLWINGKDLSTTCARVPKSNSPIQDVLSNDIRCNASPNPASTTCPVPAGSTITVEMHQHSSRDCSNEAIGGAHHGPVLVYLSKVSSAATADGSTPWFKIFHSGLIDPKTDTWGNDVLNKNCGKQNVKIPSDLAPGDYLLRAETIALHSASGAGGAQFYVSCYQIKITGQGKTVPQGVKFPGAYKPDESGIMINIHYPKPEKYAIPGPPVYTGKAGTASAAAKRAVKWIG